MNKVILFLMIITSLASCTYDNEEDLFPVNEENPCGKKEVKFGEVLEVLNVRGCASCHNNGFASGGVNLEGYDNIKISVDNGALLGSIKHEMPFKPMPQGSPKIPECDIVAIEVWIAEGSKNE